MFFVGQKVVCVDGNDWYSDFVPAGAIGPATHEIVTISEIFNCVPIHGEMLAFQEYHKGANGKYKRYVSRYFRPLEAFPAREKFQEVREGFEREQVQTV